MAVIKNPSSCFGPDNGDGTFPGRLGPFVSNVAAQKAPAVDAEPDQRLDEGEALSLASAAFTDAGVLDTHTATIDSGNGSPVVTGEVAQAAGSGTVTGAHT